MSSAGLRPVIMIAACAVGACVGDSGPAGAADAAPQADADVGPDELPCDVRAVLEDACVPCHASPPNSGALLALTRRYDFFRASTLAEGQTIAESTAALLGDSLMPPPSEPPLLAAQEAVLLAWIEAGLPPGACGSIAPRPANVVCTSGDYWTDGDLGDEEMNPGLPCRDCHRIQAPAQAYFFAGTVYPTYHEEDLCKASPPPDARIEILDEDGNVTLTLLPNASGNFTSNDVSPGAVPVPFTARLVANGLERSMNTPQTSGDCNACHTEQGTHLPTGEPIDAPGRLVWPAPRTPPK